MEKHGDEWECKEIIMWHVPVKSLMRNKGESIFEGWIPGWPLKKWRNKFTVERFLICKSGTEKAVQK